MFTLFLVLTINTYITTKEINNQTLHNIKNTLSQTRSLLEFKTHSTMNIMDITALNSVLQEILERPITDYDNNVGLWAIDSMNLRKVFFSTTTNPDINNIQLYMKDGPASLFQNDDYLNLKDYQNTTWLNSLNSSSNKIRWFTSDAFNDSLTMPSLVALKKIPSSTNIFKNIGIIRINIPRHLIEQNLDEAVITQSSTALLVNSDKIVATSTNVDDWHVNLDTIINRLDTIEHFPYIDRITHDHQSYFVGVTPINYSDWKLMLVVPNKDIQRIENRAKTQFILFTIFVIPFTFPFAYWISKSITRRITLLIKNIRNVEKARFDDNITLSSRDEIGILTQNFNHMMVKISMLLDEKYTMGQEIKNMELKALQSQINPHFLYNTLDQIYWMGIRHEVSDISTIVLQLSKFYKLSLSKGEDIVPLQNELEHIQAYVHIQNVRFDDGITLNIDILDKYYNISLPKITLQPIVENAILHGILEKDSEKGSITLSAHEKNGFVHILITDDGVGMTDEQLDKYRNTQNQDTTSPHGYGLNNIDKRLKILYGEESGILLRKNIGKGITVIIVIPY